MLKKDKRGRFRKMSEVSVAKHEAHALQSIASEIRAFERDIKRMQGECVASGVDQAPSPDDTRAEDAQAAIKRIVANLSDSYELADVLVEIRNKLQRIADEAQPLARHLINSAEMPLMKDARRAGVIACLGEAIRNARQMEPWQPKVDKFATVGDMQTIGGPAAKPFEVVAPRSFVGLVPEAIYHKGERRRFGIKPPTASAFVDPVPTPMPKIREITSDGEVKRLRKDDVMLPCCSRIVRPGRKGRKVHCHGATFMVTRKEIRRID